MKKKNSKKAFTLVELLAVIVILGILLLIAIPNVSKIIETSKKNSYLDATKMAVNAVMTEADLAKSGEDPDEKFYFNESGNFCYFNFKDLDYSSGKLDGAGIVRVKKEDNGKYSYSVTATNGKYQINGVSFDDLKIENVSDTVTLTEEGINTYESSWNCLSPSTPTASTTPATPTEETIVATFPGYTITFKSEDGSSILRTSKVFENEFIPAYRPTPPSGKTFKCWKTSVSATTCYSESTSVTANLTLYVEWQDAGSGDSSGGTTSSKCPKYALLKFPNLNDGYEEFYVIDSGKSNNKLLLLSRNGLVGKDDTIRQADTIDGKNIVGTGVYKYKSSSNSSFPQHDDYIEKYRTYLTNMGLNVIQVNSFTIEELSYYCSGLPAVVSSTHRLTCSSEALAILSVQGSFYWTDIPYSTSSSSYGIRFSGGSLDYVNGYNSSHSVRPVVTLVRSSVSQCN